MIVVVLPTVPACLIHAQHMLGSGCRLRIGISTKQKPPLIAHSALGISYQVFIIHPLEDVGTYFTFLVTLA